MWPALLEDVRRLEAIDASQARERQDSIFVLLDLMLPGLGGLDVCRLCAALIP